MRILQTLLLCLMIVQLHAQCQEQDYIALRALYLNTGGDNWTNNTNWPDSVFFVANPTMPTGTDVDIWYGVTTNEDGCVSDLSLRYKGLTGSIPSELANLSHLESLDLQSNQLSGSILPGLGQLSNLIELDLHGNQLSGSIPPDLGQLSNLEYLNLSYNDFTGSIPPELGQLSNLIELILHQNELSGTIPPDLGNLSNLTKLMLHLNQLSGSIPPELGQLSNLKYLNLRSNDLTGSIPPDLGNLSHLEDLCLRSNDLMGSIPPELGNLDSLIILNLSYNDLTGSIPPDLGQLSNLEYLSLSNNGLSGSIPPELGNLSNLTELFLYKNQLSGSIPLDLGNLSNLRTLHLHENQLNGSIPPELGQLGDLERLNMQSNNLSGNIPPELGNLINLTYLGLSYNDLSGSIPVEIGDLSNLTELWLSNNQLTGNIPPQLGNLTDLTLLLLYNNQLTGNIPSELGDLSNLTNLRLYDNQLSGCYHSNLLNLCDQLTNSTNNYISYSNNFDASWEDFCAMTIGICNISLVLPGDCNNDSITDGRDMLYWALAYGSTGPLRSNATTDWIPQPSPDWNDSVNDVNNKHQDANGDGIVDELDLEVISANFGMTSGNQPFVYNQTNAMLVLDTIEADDIAGEVRIGIRIASDMPISTHGISAKIDVSDIIINYDNIQVDTTGSSLEPDAFMYHIDNDGILHISLARTDNIDQIIDDIIFKVVIIDEILPIIITDNIPSVVVIDEVFPLKIIGGYIMSAMPELITPIGGSSPHGPVNAPISMGLNHAYCDHKGTAQIYVEDASDYSYEWSTGETTASTGDLDMGGYTITVSDGMGDTTVVDFDIDWAFTPLNILVNNKKKRIYIDFEEGPLSEEVEISFNGRLTYRPPITNDNNYYLGNGTYSIWIRRMADECPTYIGDFIMDNPVRPDIGFSEYLINPSSVNARLDYELEQSGTVDISLYNIHGQRLRTLHHARSDAGTYQIDIDKSNLPKGIYFIHIMFITDDGTTAYKTLKLMI